MSKGRPKAVYEPKEDYEWIEELEEGTRGAYRSHWKQFLSWVNMSAKEILESRQKDLELSATDPKRYRWEDLAKKYYKSIYEKRDPPKPTRSDEHKLSVVRSFFSRHHMDLKYKRGELPEARRSTKDYAWKLVDIEACSRFADPKENWVLLGGKSLGQRASDFVAIKRVEIEPYLYEEPPVPIDIDTSKENITAHPCLDRDAVEAARKYLATRTDNNPYMLPGKNGGHMQEGSLTLIVRRLADMAHRENPRICPYKEREKRLRFHKMRAFLNAELQNAGVDKDLRDYIIGHKLSTTAKAYTSTEVRNAYLQAIEQGRLVLPRKVNEITPKIDKRLLDFATFLFQILPPDAVKEAVKRAKKVQLSTHWDPAKEPTPTIYLILEALKKLEG